MIAKDQIFVFLTLYRCRGSWKNAKRGIDLWLVRMVFLLKRNSSEKGFILNTLATEWVQWRPFYVLIRVLCRSPSSTLFVCAICILPQLKFHFHMGDEIAEIQRFYSSKCRFFIHCGISGPCIGWKDKSTWTTVTAFNSDFANQLLQTKCEWETKLINEVVTSTNFGFWRIRRL